jgi:hypothetical protein
VKNKATRKQAGADIWIEIAARNLDLASVNKRLRMRATHYYDLDKCYPKTFEYARKTAIESNENCWQWRMRRSAENLAAIGPNKLLRRFEPKIMILSQIQKEYNATISIGIWLEIGSEIDVYTWLTREFLEFAVSVGARIEVIASP